MKLAVMQPYIFPYIGYFQLISAVDKFVVFDDVNYINKGWINRNQLLINNSPSLFTIPLQKASQNKCINEIFISLDDNWKSKFLKTIESAYKKAPMYSDVYPKLVSVIENKEQELSIFVAFSINTVCDYLGIKTEIVPSSVKYNTSQLKGEEKILSICMQEKADMYINPIGGLDLYKKETFSNKNINLKFLKSDNIVYKQFKEPYIPYLSIIDVLMFNTVEECVNLLSQHSLIENE